MAKNDPDQTPATPVAMPQMTDQQFAAMMQQILASRDEGATSALVAVLEKQGMAVKELAQQYQKSVRHSLPYHTGGGPFEFKPDCAVCKAGGVHPENDRVGHPKPEFAFHGGVIFCGGRQVWDQLSVLEVELINQFKTAGNRTSRHGTWKATIDKDGHHDRLSIEVPFRGMDARGELPSFSQILTELLYGEAVADPTTAMAMIADLQKKLAELEARAVAQ